MKIKMILSKMEQAMHIELNMGCIDTAVMGGFSAFINKSAEKILHLPEGEKFKEEITFIIEHFASYIEKNRSERKVVVQNTLSLVKKMIDKSSSINFDAKNRIDNVENKIESRIKNKIENKIESKTENKIENSNADTVKNLENNIFNDIPKNKDSQKLDIEKTKDIVKRKNPKDSKIKNMVEDKRQQVKVDNLQYLKNIGPKRAKLLKKIGINNAMDLLYYIPRRYEDRSQLKPFLQLIDGETETCRGTVVGLQELKPRRRLTITKVALRDGTGSVGYAVWFNQSYLKRQLSPGTEIIVSGKVDKKYGKVQISVADFEVLDNTDVIHAGRIVPVYSVTEGLPQRVFRTIVKYLLDNSLGQIGEDIPEYILQKYNLMGIQKALENIHYPLDWNTLKEARKRLVFEELLVLQIGLVMMKSQQQINEGIKHKKDGPLIQQFLHNLPFPFTAAQQKVLRDIFRDMESNKPMNRLLQGDVGSGKTIVSATALVKAVEGGYQGVLMAPTEILAEQHYLGLQELFTPLGIKVSLLTGRLNKKEKEKILKDIADGKTDIIIGTHALIQDEVEFKNLGVAITDEQHRFGVEQRAKLQEKGNYPDVLVMTATPIPRTLSMTVYGDLDVSVIDQLPPGRQPVKTFWINEHKRDQMYGFIREQIKEGRQAYIVCPLVEESEKLEVEAATEMSQRLAHEVFPDLKLSLIHGRMKADDKEAVMMSFRDGDIDILVATTVIEVGVNVPNATVMVVEGAERFGLAQLHQLRGRVGRGEHQSFCILVADPKTEEGKARMQIMQSSSDGFVIAEEDLKLRGPGDFLGTRQSGLPDLKIADLLRDIKTMEMARRTAFEIVDNDPGLSNHEHKELKELVLQRFENKYKFMSIS